jgi:cephalosporin hydroxylase
MAPIKTYLEAYKEHNGFASHKWIHYFFIYDRIFKRFLEKGQPIKMLEIGVQNGGSLEIWKKYLPQGSIIHGVDIDEKCHQLKFSENIFFHLGNAVDINFMEKTFCDTQFDVIIDDGSHVCKDVIKTFNYLFPKLKNGGCYIVEDIHTSYWLKFGGGKYNRKSSIEYFKKLIDYGINKDYIEYSLFDKIKDKFLRRKNNNSEISRNISHVVEFKRNRYNVEILKSISQISFFDSICTIDKFYGIKEVPFKNVVTGEIALVDKEPTELNVNIRNMQSEINKTEKLFCG